MEGPKDRLRRKDRRTPSSRRTGGRLHLEGPIEEDFSQVDEPLTPPEEALASVPDQPPEQQKSTEMELLAGESQPPPSESDYFKDDYLEVPELDRMLAAADSEVSD